MTVYYVALLITAVRGFIVEAAEVLEGQGKQGDASQHLHLQSQGKSNTTEQSLPSAQSFT
jgi:hypothetical protein